LILAALVIAVLGAPAARARDFLGKPLKGWAAELNDKNAQVRRGAAFALGKFPDDADRVVAPLLRRIDKDDDAGVRHDAATALGDVGLPAARPAVDPLLKMVEKEDDEVAKKTALEKLINLVGPEDKDAARALYALLDDEDPETANLAAFVLAKIGG